MCYHIMLYYINYIILQGGFGQALHRDLPSKSIHGADSFGCPLALRNFMPSTQELDEVLTKQWRILLEKSAARKGVAIKCHQTWKKRICGKHVQ